MLRFIESVIGQVILRNGILALILAYSLWSDQTKTERLFNLIEAQIAVSAKVLEVLRTLQNERGVAYYGR